MKIYCMSDIHACLESFEAALENVICHLDEDDTNAFIARRLCAWW